MEKLPPYVGWALLSAIFAALTAVLGKKGVEEVPSNLAVAIRVVVVLVFAAAIAWATKQTGFAQVSRRAYVFLALSGIATGASWLCYYRALQLGPVAKIAPIDKLSFVLAVVLAAIFLHERPSLNVIAGCVLIVIGVLLTLRP